MAKKTYSVKALKPKQDSDLATLWNDFKEKHPTNWSYAFHPTSTVNEYTFLSGISDEMINKLDFSGSESNTSCYLMFCFCKKMTKCPELNIRSVTNINYMFYDCSLLKDASGLKNINISSMNYTFYNCTSLETLPTPVSAYYITSYNHVFDNCTSLKRIPWTNIRGSLDVSTTGLEHDGLVELIGNLWNQRGKTLTMGAEKLALLSDEEKAVATGKGWTLA